MPGFEAFASDASIATNQRARRTLSKLAGLVDLKWVFLVLKVVSQIQQPEVWCHSLGICLNGEDEAFDGNSRPLMMLQSELPETTGYSSSINCSNRALSFFQVLGLKCSIIPRISSLADFCPPPPSISGIALKIALLKSSRPGRK